MSLKKPKAGAKKKGIKIPTRRLSFATPRYKDECFGPLSDDSQKRAAEAHRMGNLDLLDGKLQCECGKMVGARVSKLSTMSNYFEPDPRPHERYKEPRRPARKPGGGKRT